MVPVIAPGCDGASVIFALLTALMPQPLEAVTLNVPFAEADE